MGRDPKEKTVRIEIPLLYLNFELGLGPKGESKALNYMQKIKLICFDLDDTITEENSWYKLNLALGMTSIEDNFLYKKYHTGAISYEDWIAELLKFYKSKGQANLKNITDTISSYSYRTGVKEIIEYLKGKGYTIALISGSFNIMVDLVAKDLDIKLAGATNIFVFDTKDNLENIVSLGKDSVARLNILEDFCLKLGINIDECVCIGDGDNDIDLFKKTKLGITFKGSQIEKDAWKVIEHFSDIKQIL